MTHRSVVSSAYLDRLTRFVEEYRPVFSPWMFRPREVARVVVHAADALDAYAPGWHRQVDVTVLDMYNSCRCVLGQLFGDFATGYDAIVRRYRVEHGVRVTFGFSAFVPRELWIAEIERRRELERVG